MDLDKVGSRILIGFTTCLYAGFIGYLLLGLGRLICFCLSHVAVTVACLLAVLTLYVIGYILEVGSK